MRRAESLTWGVCGDPLAPQKLRAFGILHPLQSKCGTVQAVVAGTSPSMLPSNGGTPGRARPATMGNFPSQTQGDCGTDGTFPLLPPWETKGPYFKILPLFWHMGGPEEARASSKHRIKAQTRCSRGPGQELPDTAQIQAWLWERHTGVALTTPRDKNDKVSCRENTAWSWGQMARAIPGRCRAWMLEQRGVLHLHGAHSPIPVPSCPNPGPGPAGHCIHTAPTVSAPWCYSLSVKCIFQTAFNGRQYFLAGLTLHVWQLRAAFSLHDQAAVHAACRAVALSARAFLLEPFPAGRAR